VRRDADYYAILGVGPEAEIEEIELAYQRERAKPCDEERAVLLAEARSVLSDAESRAEYDARVVGQEIIDETADAILDAHLPRARLRALRRRPKPS
jgi:curved DNA-binding protein CbpA